MSNLSVMVRVKLITSLILFIKEDFLQDILRLVSQLGDLKIFTGTVHLTQVVNPESMSLKVWLLVEIIILRVIVRIFRVMEDTMGTL